MESGKILGCLAKCTDHCDKEAREVEEEMEEGKVERKRQQLLTGRLCLRGRQTDRDESL